MIFESKRELIDRMVIKLGEVLTKALWSSIHLLFSKGGKKVNKGRVQPFCHEQSVRDSGVCATAARHNRLRVYSTALHVVYSVIYMYLLQRNYHKFAAGICAFTFKLLTLLDYIMLHNNLQCTPPRGKNKLRITIK